MPEQAANPKASCACPEGIVDTKLDYKPLPFQPEVLEVPVIPVDFPTEYRTPAQEVAWSEPDVVEEPIPVLRKDYEPEPSAVPSPQDPLVRFRTITVPDNTDYEITEILPYRRVVTVHSIGDAARVTLAFHSLHEGESMLVLANGDLPLDVPVFPFQSLIVRHHAGVDEEMSFCVEPRGDHR